MANAKKPKDKVEKVIEEEMKEEEPQKQKEPDQPELDIGCQVMG